MDRELPGRTQIKRAPAILKAPGTVANGPDLGSRCLKLTDQIYINVWRVEREKHGNDWSKNNSCPTVSASSSSPSSRWSPPALSTNNNCSFPFVYKYEKNTKIIVYKSGKKYKNICLQVGPKISKSLSHLWKISNATVSFRIIQLNLQAILIITICRDIIYTTRTSFKFDYYHYHYRYEHCYYLQRCNVHHVHLHWRSWVPSMVFHR